MSKFWQKKYISKYTGAEIDAAVAKAGDATKVTANPTLAGTEAALEGLQVGDTKYKSPVYVVEAETTDFQTFTCIKSLADIQTLITQYGEVVIHLIVVVGDQKVDYGYYYHDITPGNPFAFRKHMITVTGTDMVLGFIDLVFNNDNTKTISQTNYTWTVTVAT